MEPYIAQPYIASSPKAQISGANCLALVGNLRENEMSLLVEEYGFSLIDPDGWYPQQKMLDLLKSIEQQLTWEDLVAVGLKSVEVAILPPGIDSFDGALDMFATAHHLNHRHIPENEGYEVTRSAGQRIITCNVPYPPFVAFGVVHGFIRRFGRGEERHLAPTIADRKTPCKILIA